jgi:hypothetical protein
VAWHCHASPSLPPTLTSLHKYTDFVHSHGAQIVTAIVGSSGSTPLHFAAATGHSNVFRSRFLHVAHADQTDKHGVMPEILARESEGGSGRCVERVVRLLANRDRDFGEREGDNRNGS